MSLRIVLIFFATTLAQDVPPPTFLQTTPSPRPGIIPPIQSCPANYYLTSEGCVPNFPITDCVSQNCAPNSVNCCQCCSLGSQQLQCGYPWSHQYQQSTYCAQQCKNQGCQACNVPTNCQLQPPPCNNFNPTTCPPYIPHSNPCHPSYCPGSPCHPDIVTSTSSTITTPSTGNGSTPPTSFPPNTPNGDGSTPSTPYFTKTPQRNQTRRTRRPHKYHNFHYNIVIPPINNTIININNITRPVIVNNQNIVNFYVYSSVRCADGSIRTMIVKNNETITECTDVNVPSEFEEKDTTTPRDDDYSTTVFGSGETTEKTKNDCCEIYTPRRCEKVDGGWRCGHRRYNYCLSFCGTHKKVYLQPRKPIYQGFILVVPALQIPNHNYCYGRHCNPPVGECDK
jgi:hypothetical protein